MTRQHNLNIHAYPNYQALVMRYAHTLRAGIWSAIPAL